MFMPATCSTRQPSSSLRSCGVDIAATVDDCTDAIVGCYTCGAVESATAYGCFGFGLGAHTSAKAKRVSAAARASLPPRSPASQPRGWKARAKEKAGVERPDDSSESSLTDYGSAPVCAPSLEGWALRRAQVLEAPANRCVLWPTESSCVCQARH